MNLKNLIGLKNGKMIKNFFKKLKLLPITIFVISVTFIYNRLIRHILNGVIGVFKTIKKLKLDKSYFNTKEKKKTFKYNTQYDGLMIILTWFICDVIVRIFYVNHLLLVILSWVITVSYVIYMERKTRDNKYIKYYEFKDNLLNYDYKIFNYDCEVNLYKEKGLMIGDEVMASFIDDSYLEPYEINNIRCNINSVNKYGEISLRINEDINDTRFNTDTKENEFIKYYLNNNLLVRLYINHPELYMIKEETYDKFEVWDENM